jgi:hypothetical protein
MSFFVERIKPKNSKNEKWIFVLLIGINDLFVVS